MEKIEYTPIGVCSKRMSVAIEKGMIHTLEIEGGCNGNLQGIAQLVKGMAIEEVLDRLDGIACGNKATSCPDQFAQALKEYLNRKEQL